MTQSSILVPASRLTKSSTNVRRASDPTADAQLEASIAEHGVLQNLVGVPVARKKGHFRITAGGRRLDAVLRLIERQVFGADHLVPVLPLPDSGNAIEISLAENDIRLAMNPADACRAFQDIIETEGKTVADVARRFGLTERFVLGRLRLAGLATPIFDELASGAISLDVAMAYASVSDTERQAAVHGEMANGYYRHNVGEIRRLLASHCYRSSHPKALLVGRDAYLAAGGRVDQDLFSTAETESWTDTAIVDRLAEEQLRAAAAAIQARDGFGEVRILAGSDIPYSETRDLTRIVGETVPPTEAQEHRIVEIEAELEAAYARGDPETDEEKEKVQALEQELDALQDRPIVIADAVRAQAVAYLIIDADGQPVVHEKLYLASNPTADEADAGETDDGAGDDESVEDARKPGISQRLADELAIMKTELLALHVASDPAFALDLGTFLMAEAATRTMGGYGIPSDLRAMRPTSPVHGFQSGMPAAEQWTALDAALNRSWTAAETIEGRYDAFCGLGDEQRASWLGWAIARTLHAVPSDRAGAGFLGHLGAKLEIDVARWWRPTARTYFDRITKPNILGMFEEIGGVELRQRYAGSKKHDLAASAERLFAGDVIVEADVKARALEWLPDQMRFTVAPTAGDDTLGPIEAAMTVPCVDPADPIEPGSDMADAA